MANNQITDNEIENLIKGKEVIVEFPNLETLKDEPLEDSVEFFYEDENLEILKNLFGMPSNKK